METQIKSVQRARLCVFANETSSVFVSAAMVATIVARIEGDFTAVVAPGVPVIWLPQQDIVRVLGESSWDAVVHRLGFGLLSITFAAWDEHRVLSMVQTKFPTAALLELKTVE